MYIIPVIHFIQGLTYSNEKALNQVFIELDKLYFSKSDKITHTKLKTIASTGAGDFINITGSDTLVNFKKRYPILNNTNSKENFQM